jgi:para-nitrobenzyl esterase
MFDDAISRRTLLGAGASLAVGGGILRLRDRQTKLLPTTAIAPPYVVVATRDGKVRGGQCRGALAFKGIAYAGSVSGPNRFKPAPPAAPWSGVRDCLSLGTPSLQSPKTIYGEHEPHPGEDCLVLNVWTPAADGHRRPVLFYNHGGGFMTGSAGSMGQDGGQLAANHDVVVVASNHRLGLAGYLTLEEIGGAEYAGCANNGMTDIVAALRWVHQNIAAFGGDPHNVTVFGESGGGAKTCALMAMPSAVGLFHKAGIMSGPMITVANPEEAHAVSRAVLTELQVSPSDLRPLLDVPPERLLEVQSADSVRKAGGFGPYLDRHVISQHPFSPSPAAFVKHIPVLVGNNRDEATFFFWQEPSVFKMDEAQLVARLESQMGKERASRELEVFRRERPEASSVELYIAIETAGMWGDNITIAERKATQHGSPVYMYRFDYESNYPIKGTDWTLRAGHATEILAKFENADLPGLMGSKPDRFEAAKNFGEVWASFARTGHPHAPGVKTWPAYNLTTRETGIVDVTCRIEGDPHRAEREYLKSLPQSS